MKCTINNSIKSFIILNSMTILQSFILIFSFYLTDNFYKLRAQSEAVSWWVMDTFFPFPALNRSCEVMCETATAVQSYSFIFLKKFFLFFLRGREKWKDYNLVVQKVILRDFSLYEHNIIHSIQISVRQPTHKDFIISFFNSR